MGGDVMNQGSLVVEFLGPPASGKTTVSDQLSELLKPAGRIHTRRDLLPSSVASSKRRTASAFVRAGPVVWWLPRIVLRRPFRKASPRDRLGQMLRVLNYFVTIRESVSPDELNIYLLDQWLVRFLAGLMNQTQITRNQAASILRAYHGSFHPLFVRLDVDHDLLVERLFHRVAERGRNVGDGWNSPLGPKSKTEIAERSLSSQKANKAADELLRDLGAEVVVLDGSRAPADLSNSIKQLLIKEGRLPIDHLDRAR